MTPCWLAFLLGIFLPAPIWILVGLDFHAPQMPRTTARNVRRWRREREKANPLLRRRMT